MIKNLGIDGLNHINIYSKAETELGRKLSNFADLGFYWLPVGKFRSIEGFWYWLSTRDDRLRNLHGYEAKKLGMALSRDINIQVPDFEKQIKIAILIKIISRPELLSEFLTSTLPFVHYYKFNNVILEPKEGIFIISFLEDMREVFKSPDAIFRLKEFEDKHFGEDWSFL